MGKGGDKIFLLLPLLVILRLDRRMTGGGVVRDPSIPSSRTRGGRGGEYGTGLNPPRDPGSRIVAALRVAPHIWVPAFAGMTWVCGGP